MKRPSPPEIVRRRSRRAPSAAGLVLLLGALAACSGSDGDARRGQARSDAPLDVRLASADAAAGAAVFRVCAACHGVAAGGGDHNGPNLYGVVGKRLATGSRRFGYTASLRDVGGTWTPDRLDAWLANPRAFAPGTRMVFAGLPNGVDRADVIAFLTANGPRGRRPGAAGSGPGTAGSD